MALEADVEAQDVGDLIADFQERLFRLTPSDQRAELASKFEDGANLRVLWRSAKGEVLGAALVVLEGAGAELALLHIRHARATVEATGRLLDATLAFVPSTVRKVRAMGGITTRWLHVLPSDARAVLLSRGFLAFDRVLLARDLRRGTPPVPEPPQGFTFAAPDPQRTDVLADFAYRAYAGTPDFGIIVLDETPEAYARLYGRFLSGEMGPYAPELSLAALDAEGALAGVLHTVIPAREPYIGDLSVLAPHRGKGLGRHLLLRALHAYQEAGHRRASLTVTAQNTPAYNLYRSVGFEVERSGELYYLRR